MTVVSEVVVKLAGDCPYLGMCDSCTHPHADEEHGSHEQCVNPHYEPPPWCPLRESPITIRMHAEGESA